MSNSIRIDLLKQQSTLSERDVNNLCFLLSANREQLFEWFQQCDEEDLAYANDLLNTYNSILSVRNMELDETLDMDCTQSMEYLKHFTLKGEKNASRPRRKQKKAQQTDSAKGKLRREAK